VHSLTNLLTRMHSESSYLRETGKKFSHSKEIIN